jgi:hypothetical protein
MSPVAATINEDWYVVGGHDGKMALATGGMYHAAASGLTGSWTPLPPMHHARFAAGGCASVHLPQSVGINPTDLDRKQNTVLVVCGGSGPPPRSGYTSISGTNTSASTTSTAASCCLSSCEIYNPKTKQWTELPPMPTARAGCCACAVGHVVVVVGGDDGGGGGA